MSGPGHPRPQVVAVWGRDLCARARRSIRPCRHSRPTPLPAKSRSRPRHHPLVRAKTMAVSTPPTPVSAAPAFPRTFLASQTDMNHGSYQHSADITDLRPHRYRRDGGCRRIPIRRRPATIRQPAGPFNSSSSGIAAMAAATSWRSRTRWSRNSRILSSMSATSPTSPAPTASSPPTISSITSP